MVMGVQKKCILGVGWVESVVLWWGNGKGDDGGGGVKKVYFRCELGWECDVVVVVGLGV